MYQYVNDYLSYKMVSKLLAATKMIEEKHFKKVLKRNSNIVRFLLNCDLDDANFKNLDHVFWAKLPFV